MTAISDRIQQIQNRFELNDVELGKLVGVTKAAIGRWKNGQSNPSAESVVTLRLKLGVSEIWLVQGTGPMMAKELFSDRSVRFNQITADQNEQVIEDILEYARFYIEAKGSKQKQ